MNHSTCKSLLIIAAAALLMVAATAASASADTLTVQLRQSGAKARTVVVALPARGSAKVMVIGNGLVIDRHLELSLEAEAGAPRGAERPIRYDLSLSAKTPRRFRLQGSADLRYGVPVVVGGVQFAGAAFEVVLTRNATRAHHGCFVGS